MCVEKFIMYVYGVYKIISMHYLLYSNNQLVTIAAINNSIQQTICTVSFCIINENLLTNFHMLF